MIAYELLAHLKHLTLAGCENGELLWNGTQEEWSKMSDEVKKNENNWFRSQHDSNAFMNNLPPSCQI